MEKKGGRNADEGDEIAEPIVDPQGALADVVGAEGEESIDHACSAGRGLGLQDDVAAIVEPDFEQQDRHQVPEINEAEHRHGGRAMRRQIHLERALGMAEMQLQRQRRDQQERQGCEQRQAVGRLHSLDTKDTLERCEDEGTRDQSGDEGIENDEDAPLELHFVRVHEAFDWNLQRASLSLPETTTGAKALEFLNPYTALKGRSSTFAAVNCLLPHRTEPSIPL